MVAGVKSRPEGLLDMAAQEPSPQAVFDAMEQFNKQGNQIFVTLVKGREYPPATVDVRCRYVETIGDLRKKVAEKMGCPAEKQLLFYKQRELTPEMDGKTMLDLSLHTGFSVTGYDLREPPVFFPPVVPSPEGLKVACSMVFPDGIPDDVVREGYPECPTVARSGLTA